MQKSFRLSSPQMRANGLLACASLWPVLFPASSLCDPYTSTWVSGPKSSLRLIAAADGPQHSAYRAGIEIRLEPGALTYWRLPGGAGVPPVFSFDGSINAAEIVVSYPMPTRFDEEGTEVFGYRDHVIFPVHITPEDSSCPVLLALKLSYAVCAQICLPVKAEARLTLSPDRESGTSAANPEADAIAAAEALVPEHLTPEQAKAKVAIARDDAAAAPAWRLSPRGGTAQEIFVEGPPGWYFATRRTGRPNEFLIVEAERPPGDTRTGPPVTLTVKDEPGSYEFTVDLDAASGRGKDVKAAPEALSRPPKP
jgi:DsbC/DsbD-like thiol-disulfide interchange protein